MSSNETRLRERLGSIADGYQVGSIDLAAAHHGAALAIRRRRHRATAGGVAAVLVLIGGGGFAVTQLAGGRSVSNGLQAVPVDSSPISGLAVSETFDLPVNPPQGIDHLSGSGDQLWVTTSPIGPYRQIGRVYRQHDGVLQQVSAQPNSASSVAVVGNRAFVVTGVSSAGLGDGRSIQETAPVLKEYDATTGRLLARESLAIDGESGTSVAVVDDETTGTGSTAELLQFQVGRHRQSARATSLASVTDSGVYTANDEAPLKDSAGFHRVPITQDLDFNDAQPQVTLALLPQPVLFLPGSPTYAVDLSTGQRRVVPGTRWTPPAKCRSLERRDAVDRACSSPDENILGLAQGRLLIERGDRNARIESLNAARLNDRHVRAGGEVLPAGALIGAGRSERVYLYSFCPGAKPRDDECLQQVNPTTLASIGTPVLAREAAAPITSAAGNGAATYGYRDLPEHSPSGGAPTRIDLLTTP